jgi:hypothetical protein
MVQVELTPDRIGSKIATWSTGSIETFMSDPFDTLIKINIETAFRNLRRYILANHDPSERIGHVVVNIEYQQDGWDFQYILRAYSVNAEVINENSA